MPHEIGKRQLLVLCFECSRRFHQKAMQIWSAIAQKGNPEAKSSNNVLHLWPSVSRGATNGSWQNRDETRNAEKNGRRTEEHFIAIQRATVEIKCLSCSNTVHAYRCIIEEETNVANSRRHGIEQMSARTHQQKSTYSNSERQQRVGVSVGDAVLPK